MGPDLVCRQDMSHWTNQVFKFSAPGWVGKQNILDAYRTSRQQLKNLLDTETQFGWSSLCSCVHWEAPNEFSQLHNHNWDPGKDFQPPGSTSEAHRERKRACFPLGAELAPALINNGAFPLTQPQCARREGEEYNELWLFSSTCLTTHLLEIAIFNQKAKRNAKFSENLRRLNYSFSFVKQRETLSVCKSSLYPDGCKRTFIELFQFRHDRKSKCITRCT